MENSNEFLIRMRIRMGLCQEAIDMARIVKEPYLVLYSTLTEKYKVENASAILIDRDAALAGEIVLLFAGFPTSFYTYNQLKELVKSQLVYEAEEMS